MYTDTILNELLNKGELNNFLNSRNPDSHEGIQELQNFLYEVGYGRKLKWGPNRILGFYDRHTSRAVKAFSKNNNFGKNGDIFTAPMLEVLFKLHSLLDDLQLLHYDLKARQVKRKYFKNSPHKTNVAALQKLLFSLGYAQELDWDLHHNDGVFGDKTTLALSTFALHQGIKSDGSKLTRKLAKRIIKELSPLLGKDWKNTRILLQQVTSPPIAEEETEKPDTTQPAPNTAVIEVASPIGRIPLQVYENTRFVGSRVLAHTDFFRALDRINLYAEKSDVMLLITSSFRTSYHVEGAIVNPARMSNHMIGHAIDMNFKYGEGYTKICNSSCLKQQPFPKEVEHFITLIRQDLGLRWGGDFSYYDPVHIDDHFNQDLNAWALKFNSLKEAERKGMI